MNPFAKQADEPYAAGVSPEMAHYNNSLKAEALKRALKAGLIGLGSGAGVAAILGLPHLLRPTKIPSYPLKTEIDVPYPQLEHRHGHKTAGMATSMIEPMLTPLAHSAKGSYEGHRHEEGALRGGARGLMIGLGALPGGVLGGMAARRFLGHSLHKPAGKLEKLLERFSPRSAQLTGEAVRGLPALTGSFLGGSATSKALEPATGRVADAVLGEKQSNLGEHMVRFLGLGTQPGQPSPAMGSPHWFRGDSATNVQSIPWAIPSAVGAGLGGLIGGHSLVQHLYKKHRKEQLEKELQHAQEEYENAMLSQYDPSKLRDLSGNKEAAAGTTLDVCFDLLEKRGFKGLSGHFHNAVGTGAGLYGTYAGLLGVGTGIGVYKWLKDRSGEKNLRSALKRRAHLRNLQSPPEVHVRPVPVRVKHEKLDQAPGEHPHHKHKEE